MMKTKVCVLLAVLVLAAAVGADGQTSIALSGDLVPGPHKVGFRTLFRFDTSRTWKNTRDFNGVFTPDLQGRPVQINVWYPAASGDEARRMHFGDYVDQRSPEIFSAFNTIMRDRNRQNAASSVAKDQLAGLQLTPMSAFADAPPAVGRFPTVLYFGGLDAEMNSNVILSEYLASHGYIVASISLLGPTDDQSFQSRTNEDLEATVRDMEFAWSIVSDNAGSEPARIAVMGHSVGAIEAVLFGMRNANVSAVIALDGTYAFQGLSTVLTHANGYAPNKMRASFLDLRRAQGAQGDDPLDLTTVDSFRHADRTFVTIQKMHHSDFTSFAMIGERFHTPITANYPLNGWSRDTAKAGYQQVSKIVLAFLDLHLRNDANARARLDAAAGQADGGVVRHEEGIAVPPSPLESAALANQQGLDSVKKLFVKICGENGVGPCIDVDRFNTLGYKLLGQNRTNDALAIFDLAAWSHPTSANAQDSLADGYLAVNDKESARSALTRAIKLAPDDPLLDAGSKSSFVSALQARLQAIR